MVRTGIPWASASLAAVALWAVGCALPLPRLDGSPPTSRAPSEPWTPPQGAPPATAPRAVPAEVNPRKALSLVDAVDIALQNQPLTRGAWERARAAALGLGAKKGGLYPSAALDLSGGETYRNFGYPDGWHTLFGPNLTLSYVILDFGGRSASIEAAREALRAADWTHNAAIQDTVLETELCFDRHVAAKALLDAAREIVNANRVSLESAEARRKAGVGSIADVLQARTAQAKAELEVQSAEGAVLLTRGALAKALGLPATTSLEVASFPLDGSIADLTPKVDAFIARALASRPDLQAARARFRAAEHKTDEARSAGLPTLSLGASASRSYLDGFASSMDIISGTVVFHIPLFDGLRPGYLTAQAASEAAALEADSQALEDAVAFQVFAAHVSLRTAASRARTAATLRKLGAESAKVALERYRAGAGTIVELLAAQAALADARGSEIQARLDWFSSLATLAHDTGILGLQDPESLAREVKR